MCFFFFNFQFYGFHQLSDLQTCNHPFLPVSPCQPRDSLGLFSQDLQSLTAWPEALFSQNHILGLLLSPFLHSLNFWFWYNFKLAEKLQNECQKYPNTFNHFHNISLHFRHHSTYDGFETLEIILSIIHFSGCFFRSRTFFFVNTASSNLRNLSLI